VPRQLLVLVSLTSEIRPAQLPARDEGELFIRAQAGDPAARERLAERYLPLARSLALRFAGRSEPTDDLIQIASLGLLRAIGRFEPGLGLAFSSYAVPTILGELRRHFRDRSWAVRPPRRLQERWLEVVGARGRLETTLGREATAEELAEAIGCSLEEVLEALEAGRGHAAASMDAPLGSGPEAISISELEGSDDGGYDEVEARLGLALATRSLTARQRAVLWLYATEDLTQDEIAKLVGISQMQVSRDLRVARRAVASSLALDGH
jgi:RNA polymerase sigma-B factor